MRLTGFFAAAACALGGFVLCDPWQNVCLAGLLLLCYVLKR